MLKLTDRIKEVANNLQNISPVDSQNLIKAIDDLKLQDINTEKMKKQAEENTKKIKEIEGIILDYQIKSRKNMNLYKECLEIYEEKKQEILTYQAKIEKYLSMYEKIKELYKEVI